MIIDSRCTIDAKPCQRQIGGGRGDAIEPLKMIAAFVADISRHMEAAGERLFNLAKEFWYLVEIHGGYGSNRIGEEEALFIERVEARGLQENRVRVSRNHRVQPHRKLSPLVQS